MPSVASGENETMFIAVKAEEAGEVIASWRYPREETLGISITPASRAIFEPIIVSTGPDKYFVAWIENAAGTSGYGDWLRGAFCKSVTDLGGLDCSEEPFPLFDTGQDPYDPSDGVDCTQSYFETPLVPLGVRLPLHDAAYSAGAQTLLHVWQGHRKMLRHEWSAMSICYRHIDASTGEMTESKIQPVDRESNIDHVYPRVVAGDERFLIVYVGLRPTADTDLDDLSTYDSFVGASLFDLRTGEWLNDRELASGKPGDVIRNVDVAYNPDLKQYLVVYTTEYDLHGLFFSEGLGSIRPSFDIRGYRQRWGRLCGWPIAGNGGNSGCSIT